MTNSVTPRPVVLLVLVLAGGILAGCATAVTLTTPVLPDGRVGEPYDFQLEADGGDSLSVVTGTLPPGISLSAEGLLAGVPLQAGDFGVKPIPSWNSPRLLMAYAAFFFDVVVSIFSSRFNASRSLGRCR